MTVAYALTGTIQDSRSVLLDEPLPVSSGRVLLTVQPSGEEPPKASYLETVERIASDLKASGHEPLSDQEIAGWVEGERNAWD